jgi:hypothetical protein
MRDKLRRINSRRLWRFLTALDRSLTNVIPAGKHRVHGCSRAKRQDQPGSAKEQATSEGGGCSYLQRNVGWYLESGGGGGTLGGGAAVGTGARELTLLLMASFMDESAGSWSSSLSPETTPE